MKKILGILLILGGLTLGIYVGFWLMLIRGIVTIINAVKADPVNASGIAWGVIRIALAGLAGTIAFWLGFITGGAILLKRPSRFSKLHLR